MHNVRSMTGLARHLAFAFYAFAAAAGLAALCVVLAVVAAACAGAAAWRVRADDIGFGVGALSYACTFAVGLAAVLSLVSPIALGLIQDQVCAQGRCAPVAAVNAQQQIGYNFAGAAAALGLVAALLGVYFIAAERARRRRI